ncbi:MAG: hypothetical protein U0636_07170 [Phycisphaerales bacterium]
MTLQAASAAETQATPAAGTQTAPAAGAQPEPAASTIISQSHGQEDFGVTPEVVLFIGAAVLTVALMALVIPFLVRKLRQEDQARNSKGDV